MAARATGGLPDVEPRGGHRCLPECCLDDQRVCGCKRTWRTMSALLLCVCVVFGASVSALFATRVVICLVCQRNQSSIGDDGGNEEDLSLASRLVVALLLVNSAIGLCIAAGCFCFWGDVSDAVDGDEPCGLRGSEKRLIWCLTLSAVFGACGLCVSGYCVFLPSCEELCLMPEARGTRSVSRRHRGAHESSMAPQPASSCRKAQLTSSWL